MLVIAASAIVYPGRFRGNVSRTFVHLPLLLVFLWPLYEHLMPAEMNIPVDLLVLPPAALIAGLCYIAKLFLLNRRPNAV
ncbi:MAG TPA: hypothetical protein VF593_13770 [Chthoniobacteraceae bacterium]|jgi:hypothetical protein